MRARLFLPMCLALLTGFVSTGQAEDKALLLQDAMTAAGISYTGSKRGINYRVIAGTSVDILSVHFSAPDDLDLLAETLPPDLLLVAVLACEQSRSYLGKESKTVTVHIKFIRETQVKIFLFTTKAHKSKIESFPPSKPCQAVDSKGTENKAGGS